RRESLYHCRPRATRHNFQHSAPVAQLDRVLPSEGRGHWFESSRVHHIHKVRAADAALTLFAPRQHPLNLKMPPIRLYSSPAASLSGFRRGHMMTSPADQEISHVDLLGGAAAGGAGGDQLGAESEMG